VIKKTSNLLISAGRYWSKDNVSTTGAALTAVLFESGRWVIGLYLAHSTQPSAFGAAASFAALLLWLYYTAQIFLFGAEFTACLGGIDREAKAADDHPDRPIK
jgi:uncharacterized BrkB/YihY/UPF0761 family membrane protein